MEISKKYAPAEIENTWTSAWEKAQAFKSVPDDREPYTIAIPPPNVTGILHMGHVLNNTIQDVLIRRKRMEGYNACWVPGTDHASIATEAKVVAMLADKGIKKTDIGRKRYLEYAWQWREKYGGIILKQLRKLGASCDWDRTRFTMDKDYSASVLQVFCDLYEKGLIRMVNWDPVALTAVSDEEVNHKDTPGHLYHVRYPIDGLDGEYVTIATTRPETILGDTAIAIHPEDERYTHLHGKFAIVPVVNRKVPIVLDSYVDKDFGTGCLKVTPAHDVNDYEIGIRHSLPSIDIFEDNGSISEKVGAYVGMDRFDVRKQIVKDLKSSGNMVNIEDHMHAVGYSERTHAAIEPKLSMQWFLNMQEISKPAYKAVMDGEVNLLPEKFINTYKHWMENIRDWCLSRQLWWGHQIPAYYIQGSQDFVVALSPEEALEKAKAKTGNPALSAEDLEQDPDVLDTWASSWLWPISVFNGLTEPDNADFAYYYPTNDLVTAPEILFFWVARMIISGYHYTSSKPFTNVYLHGIVRDIDGRKMAKQYGNSPDPLDLIAEYGADGVRMGILKDAAPGNDTIFKHSLDKNGKKKYDLIEEGRNFANKIWNAFRLIKGWTVDDSPSTEKDEIALKWMRARIQESAHEIADHFSKFRINDALMSVRKLKWDEYCSWFLEMIKPAYGQAVAKGTYDQVIELLEQLLQLLHPFMPFITEEIWQNLRTRSDGEFIATSRLFELQSPDSTLLTEMRLVQDSITAVRRFRTDKQIPFKEAIELYIHTDTPEVFKAYQSIMEKFLHTSTIGFTEEQPDNSASIRVGKHEFYIPFGSVDVEAEREKIQKEIDYTQGFLNSVLKKLNNQKFVENAPEKVVAMEKKKKADAEAKLAVLKESLAQLGG